MLAIAVPAQAQHPTPASSGASRHVDALLSCRSQTDPQVRLGCFDREAERLAQARGRGDVTVLDRERVQATRRSLFGFSSPGLDPFADSGDGAAKEPLREVESVVQQVAGGGSGLYVLRLKDGSVWRLTESTPLAPRVGDAIRIVKGTLGGYRAAIRGRRMLRIVRVR